MASFKITGKPLFGLDYKAEGMVYASVLRPPAFGQKLQSFNAAKAKAVEGFLKGMGLGNNDATIRKMFEEMANNMPLRGIVLFQQGKLSYRKMHLLLAILNKQPLRALKFYYAKDE